MISVALSLPYCKIFTHCNLLCASILTKTAKTPIPDNIMNIAIIRPAAVTDSNNGGSQKHANKAYDITGSDALSYSQVAEILSNEIGKKISYRDVTEEDARKGMKQLGADDWFIDAMLELFRITRAGYGSQTTTAVEHIVGRKPISFAKFAKDYAEVL